VKLQEIGRVDGLVSSDEDVRKLMLDRKAWPPRSRIQVAVAANKEVDSSKSRRGDGKIQRVKSRSFIVAILYNLIELRDILSRLVVVIIVVYATL
jgi:hypothetical protein